VRWPGSVNDGLNLGLFADDNIKQGVVVGQTDATLRWTVPCEFVSTIYDEPLECVQARRQAFGGECIRFDAPIPTGFPERCLLSSQVHATEYRRGSIRLRWLLDTVFEAPKFCVMVAFAEYLRVEHDWFAHSDSLKMLQAAMHIKPTTYDVVGVYTEDLKLQGAIEFCVHVEDNVYLGHMIAATEQHRQLRAGDRLFGRYSGLIGKTKIAAERCLFEVLEVGEQPIPPLRDHRN
jgi:hypothetical protein